MADDLKEHLKSMSLGDHLEELRARLILAILGLFVGMVVCLFFGKVLIGVMSRPFEKENAKLEKKFEKLEAEKLATMREKRKAAGIGDQPQAVIETYDQINGCRAYTLFQVLGKLIEALQEDEMPPNEPNSVPPTDKPDAGDDPVREVALIAHHPTEGFMVYVTLDKLDKVLGELEESGSIIEYPKNGMPVGQSETAQITTHSPVEGFMVYIKVCMLFGLLLTSPWVIWQIWAFVSAGLYQKEKRYVHVVSPISTVLFVTGSLFFMMVVAPLVMRFLIGFNTKIGVGSLWSLQKYINMVFSLTIVFGAAFQMPIVIVFAERLGLVTVEALAKNRKFVILGLVIVAAMATPPDVISQISLAIPLYGLYEASILFCRIWRARSRKKEQSDTDDTYRRHDDL
jgi:sec-independent protein translocase protein TatC